VGKDNVNTNVAQAFQKAGLAQDKSKLLRTDFEDLASAITYIFKKIGEQTVARQKYPLIIGIIAQMREILELDTERGYQGARRGMEVCLPNLNNWPELKWSFS